MIPPPLDNHFDFDKPEWDWMLKATLAKSYASVMTNPLKCHNPYMSVGYMFRLELTEQKIIKLLLAVLKPESRDRRVHMYMNTLSSIMTLSAWSSMFAFFILFGERHTEHATTVYVWIRSLLFCIIYTAKPHAKTLCAGLSIQIWTPPLNPWHYA